MSFGVTAQGFVLKTLPDIREEVYDELAPAFDVDREASPDWPPAESAVAQLMDPPMNQLAEAWEALKAVYDSANPNAAGGVSLDNLLAMNDIELIPAAASTVILALLGDEGTIVPAGNGAKASILGDPFEAVAEVEITKDAVIRALVTVDTVANSTLYTVTVNSVAYEYTSDGSATKLEIIAGLVADLAGASAVASVVDNLDETFTITAADLETAFALDVDANLSLAEIWSPQTYECTVDGPVQALTGTVDTITNPISGLNDLINLQDAIPGRLEETEAEARIRRKQTLRKGKSTVEQIKAVLLSGDIDGITAAKVYENDTGITDADGRPPHSIEAVVSGGDSTEIGQAIFDNKAGGMETYGNTTVQAVDPEAADHDVNFTRPVSRYVHLDVVVTLNSEEDFPSDGLALVAAALLAYGQTLAVGQNVLLQGLEAAGFAACPGIARVTVEADDTAAPGDTPTFASADLVMAYNQLADFDSTRIAVA